MKASDNSALERARHACENKGLRVTPIREAVFKALLAYDKPVGAYQLLEDMRDMLDSPKPPTIYRAIEFWLREGFVHKIDSLNSYTVCRNDHMHKGSQFLVCDSCGNVTEAHVCDLPDDLNRQVTKEHFHLTYWNTEIHGLCTKCAH